MKRSIYILATVIAVGCTIDMPDVYDPELRILFQPGVYSHIEQVESNRFTPDMTMGVCAWLSSEDESWQQNVGDEAPYLPLSEAYYQEVTVQKGDSNITHTDTYWMVSDSTLWPSTTENLTFLAYAPYEAHCGCDAVKGVTYTTNTLDTQVDLLYTTPHTERYKSSNGGIVQLQFDHALCCVNFRVKNRVTTDEKITLKRITIDKVHYKGSFASLCTPQWQLDEETTALSFYEGSHETQGLPEEIGDSYLLLPQQLDTQMTVEWEYTTAAGTSIEQRLQTIPLNMTLEAGWGYTYTLSIGIDDVKFLKEIVEHRFK